MRRFGNFWVQSIDYKQSSERWLGMDNMKMNTVELWMECNGILWNCERSAMEYCGTVNGVQLNTVELWTECNWILWNCERSATEYCGTVNGVQLNTVELWTIWNSWPLLCLHCVSDSKESLTVRFSFCHWTPCVSLSWTELLIKPRKKQRKKYNHFRSSVLYWSRPYRVRVVQ
jgi:hypothetical protein